MDKNDLYFYHDLGGRFAGDVLPSEVRKDKTFTSSNGEDQTGTLDLTTNLTPANLKAGVLIDGVQGNAQGSYLGAGNATAADVVSPFSFSNEITKGISGTMPDNGAPLLTCDGSSLPAGFYSGGSIDTAQYLVNDTIATTSLQDNLDGTYSILA